MYVLYLSEITLTFSYSGEVQTKNIFTAFT